MAIAVDASTSRYYFEVQIGVADVGLQSALDTDSRTLSYDTTPPRQRDQTQKDNIKAAWDARNIPDNPGLSSDKFIDLMNLVGISPGDIVWATGESASSVRSWLLQSTYWAPGELDRNRFDSMPADDMSLAARGVSSQDIIIAEMRGSPVGPIETWFHSGFYLGTGSQFYVRFPTSAPYGSKNYSINYHIKRNLGYDPASRSNQWKQYGFNRSIDLVKTYDVIVPETYAGFLYGGNVYTPNDDRSSKPGPTDACLAWVGQSGSTTYRWRWRLESPHRTVQTWTGGTSPFDDGPVFPGQGFTYSIWSMDDDVQVGGIRSSSEVYGTPSSSIFTTGGGAPTAPQPTSTSININTIQNNISSVKGVLTTATPIGVTGGKPPYAYSVSPALPEGLIFNSSTGQITGSSFDTAANTTYTITVVDSANTVASTKFDLAVLLNGPGTGAPNEFYARLATGLENLAHETSRIRHSLSAIDANLQATTRAAYTTGIRTTTPYDWRQGIDLYSWYSNETITTSTQIQTERLASISVILNDLTQNLPKFK